MISDNGPLDHMQTICTKNEIMETRHVQSHSQLPEGDRFGPYIQQLKKMYEVHVVQVRTIRESKHVGL